MSEPTNNDVPYGCRLLPQLVDEKAESHPTQLMGMIAKSSDLSHGFFEFTYKDIANAVNFMSWWLLEKLGPPSEDKNTIAYIGITDFRYLVMELAAIKIGYIILIPSIRNSQENFTDLFTGTNVNGLFFSGKLPINITGLVHPRPAMKAFEIPEFDEMTQEEGPPYLYSKTWDEAKDDVIICHHTSGTTGSPKPIYHTHRFYSVLDALRKLRHIKSDAEPFGIFLIGEVPNTRVYFGMPFFHFGGCASVFSALFNEAVAVLGPTDSLINAKLVCNIVKKARCRVIVQVPSITDDIAKYFYQEFLDLLPDLEIIISSGGPLSATTGDLLASKVRLGQVYGSTEAGSLAQQETSDEDWGWMRFNFDVGGLKMEPLEDDPGRYELVIRKIPQDAWIQGVFAIFPSLEEWRTRDIFEKHPSKPLYRFSGRIDDVIVLSNGEKLNPARMEIIISAHELLTGALVIGLGRTQVSLLIEPKKTLSDSVLIDAVWPLVEQANEAAPGHGKILRNMILVATSEKRFPRTGKGSIIRSLTVALYEREIDLLYTTPIKSIDVGSWDSLPSDPVMQIPSETFQQFINDCVVYLQNLTKATTVEANNKFLPADDDFSLLGLDSLKITQLSNMIQSSFQPLMPTGQLSNLTTRFIYENSTIKRLSIAIFKMAYPLKCVSEELGRLEKKSLALAPANKYLEDLIQNYSSNFPAKEAKTVHKPHGEGLHVLLTGSTGYLGYYLLKTLIADSNVAKILCFNRGWTEPRNNSIEESGGLDGAAKVQFVKVSFGEPRFGLTPAVHQSFLDTVDVIIHNAWPVDFNLSIKSFEKIHIAGIRNFIDWSILSPRKVTIQFVSSVGSFGNWSSFRPKTPVSEEVFTDGDLPTLGYGQSKFVAENILNNAAKQRGISIDILRCGQLSGPVGDGKKKWNTRDWFPILMQTSKALGLIPSNLGAQNLVQWIPIDSVSQIIIELMQGSGTREGSTTFNLINPASAYWTDLLPTVKDVLEVTKEVSLKDWLKELKKHDDKSREELEKFPALKLLNFFEWVASEEQLVITTDNAKAASASFRELSPISKEMVGGWVKDWGF
ncbi:hypothetical protein sscle_04g036410 [Sclerotinia sclerotiorum 1980 UF-70]|uniref:Carrier domain-containing protein n=2 Tax=Sclerotinia sclerotiorum (strain ATCC 18683 / 1980 / Ss-1) TaxID=665079 RepID=A0A1D9Q1Q1_SCLS1|nr:hypothetical protein sscle_04g036410 [Sclerotinia sclerotiorum 1980 UF-70]